MRIAAGVTGVAVLVASAAGGYALVGRESDRADDPSELIMVVGGPLFRAEKTQLRVYSGRSGKWTDLGDPETYAAARLSPDGRKIASIISTGADGAWALTITNRTSRKVESSRFPGSIATPRTVDWSPDGSHLALTGRQVEFFDSAGRHLGTAGDIDLGSPSERTRWSPDGEHYGVVGARSVFILKPDGTTARRVDLAAVRVSGGIH